jgi:methyl-accepting chemotaxis protein
MKQRLIPTSVLFKFLAVLGIGLLCATAVELAVLPRNFLETTGTPDTIFSSYVIIIFLNSMLFFITALLLRHIYTRHIQNPLQELLRLLQRPPTLSSVEFANISTDSSCQEICDVSQAVRAVLLDVRHLLERIAMITGHLQDTSQGLLSNSQAQSFRMTFHHPAYKEMLEATRNVTDTARQMTLATHGIVDDALDMTRIVAQGRQMVLNIEANLEAMRRSSQMSAEKIVALEQQTEHIHEVVATIERIIEDTRLIAFNATIEAARSKDEEKGFSVVALEIKRLAEEVFESTEDIKEFVQDIQQASQTLVVSAESELKGFQQSETFAQEAGTSLQQITEMVKSTTEAATTLVTITEQQQRASERVLQLMETTVQATAQIMRDASTSTTTAERLHQQSEALDQILKHPFSEPERSLDKGV